MKKAYAMMSQVWSGYRKVKKKKREWPDLATLGEPTTITPPTTSGTEFSLKKKECKRLLRIFTVCRPIRRMAQTGQVFTRPECWPSGAGAVQISFARTTRISADCEAFFFFFFVVRPKSGTYVGNTDPKGDPCWRVRGWGADRANWAMAGKGQTAPQKA